MLLTLLASPAYAWEYTYGMPCILTHETADAAIELKYYPSEPLYSLTVRQNSPLPTSDVFAMRFDGPAGLTISTTRHSLSNDRREITVIDTGFGNVLNGLQFNTTATALLGDRAISFRLTGAADPVARFRLCKPEPGV